MKVLIAVDGSECSNAAIQSVTQRQWAEDTEFLVFSVADSPYLQYGLYPPPEGIIDAIRQHLDRIVSSDVAILKSRFPMNKVDGKVEEGEVKYTIVDKARDWNADLIIMGSHGRRGLSKLLLGSIAEAVLQLAPCSIEIIREKTQPAPKGEEGELAKSSKS